MGHLESEMTDVVVVLDELDDQQTQATADQFTVIGMVVESIDHENSVIEGTIVATKLVELKKVPHVRYVRTVFSYSAEMTSDMSDDDGDADECPP